MPSLFQDPAIALAVELLNGQQLALEVMPEMTIWEVKKLIKVLHSWEDEVSKRTTVVELILGDRKVKDDETVEGLKLAADSKLSAVFMKNLARCGNQKGLRSADLDPKAWIVVEIPETFTEILGGAFKGCTQVAKVVIGGSVRRIGEHAFRNCSSLMSVEMPSSLTSIGDFAFKASALVHVALPDSVVYLGAFAFDGCSSLTAIRLPSKLAEIGDCAFRGCGLRSLAVQGVTRIGDLAFASCSALSSVVLQGVKHIGSRAFMDCRALRELEMQDVSSIGLYAFLNCNQLTLRVSKRLLDLGVDVGCKMVAKKRPLEPSEQAVAVQKACRQAYSSVWDLSQVGARVLSRFAP